MIIQNKYSILKKVECGKFSNVFIARNIVKETLVVIKFDYDEKTKKLLQNEINIYVDLLKQAKNDFIGIKSFGAIDSNNYIVMEYIPRNIKGYIGEHMSLFSPFKTFKDLVDTVSHLHKRGYVHRDLKPDNILVKGDKIILIDLGMATKISNKISTTFVGNINFASYNTHLKQYNYGRGDDIISCFYIIFYLFSDNLLPWSNLCKDKSNCKTTHLDYYNKKKYTNYEKYYEKIKVLDELIQLYKKYVN